MINRRSFLYQCGVMTSGIGLGLVGFLARSEAKAATQHNAERALGFGPLAAIATQNSGETFLALPKGFQYNILSKQGQLMSDHRPSPPLPDGMACFQVGSTLRLIRNHEVSHDGLPASEGAIGQLPYDAGAMGGTSTLVIDPKSRQLLKDFVSLSGTLTNCAGGRTPWGSWISCEETTLGAAVRRDKLLRKKGGFAKPHGYCFEVSAKADAEVQPIPLKAMGRFRHEAVAIDPHSGIAYLTEDNHQAGFYRFLPKQPQRLQAGGRLQMLKINEQAGFDSAKGLKTGQSFAVSWVDIKEPDPATADDNDSAVFEQGVAAGGTIFARLEGAYADEAGRIYFVSTNGGDQEAGQIWFYTALNANEGTLSLFYQSMDRDVLDMPDNICLRPKSQQLFLCEDSDYAGLLGTPENYIRILTPQGKIADFAKNVADGFSSSEFAGATFSPDGETLFVNLQKAGLTFAIWGDWSRFKA